MSYFNAFRAEIQRLCKFCHIFQCGVTLNIALFYNYPCEETNEYPKECSKSYTFDSFPLILKQIQGAFDWMWK